MDHIDLFDGSPVTTFNLPWTYPCPAKILYCQVRSIVSILQLVRPHISRYGHGSKF